MASQEVVQTRTRVEKVRTIKLVPDQYRLLRSFVESSTKEGYEWRIAYDYKGYYEWRKPTKWVLRVYKHNNDNLDVVNLLEGIYKVETNVIPVAELLPVHSRAGIWFVKVGGELGIYHAMGRIGLIFTRRAPVVFAPAKPLPYFRPIAAYEVMKALDNYFAL